MVSLSLGLRGVWIVGDLERGLELFWASKILSLASVSGSGELLLSLARSMLGSRGLAEYAVKIALLSKRFSIGPHESIFGGLLGGAPPGAMEIVSRHLLEILRRGSGLAGEKRSRAEALRASYFLAYPRIWREAWGSLRKRPRDLASFVAAYSGATSVNLFSELIERIGEASDPRRADLPRTSKGLLVLVDVRRVQDYISEARRPRDLLISSLLSSTAAWASIRPLARALGPDIMLIPFPPASDQVEPLIINALHSELGMEGLRKLHPFPGSLEEIDIDLFAKTPAQILILLPGGKILERALREGERDTDGKDIKNRVVKRIEDSYRSFWISISRRARDIARSIGAPDTVLSDLDALEPEPPVPLTVAVEEVSIDLRVGLEDPRLVEALDKDLLGVYRDSLDQISWLSFHEAVKKIYGEGENVVKGRPLVKNLEKIDDHAGKICSVCGVLPAVFEWERHGASLKIQGVLVEENLCVYCLTKRLLSVVEGAVAIYQEAFGSGVEYRLKRLKRRSMERDLYTIPVAPSTGDIAIQGLRGFIVDLVGSEHWGKIEKMIEDLLRAREELRRERPEKLPRPQRIDYYTERLLSRLRKLEKERGIEVGKSVYMFLRYAVEELLEKPLTTPDKEYRETRSFEKFRKSLSDISREIEKIINTTSSSPFEVGKGFSSYYAMIYSDMDYGGRVKKGLIAIEKEKLRTQGYAEMPRSCSGEPRKIPSGEEDDGVEFYEICLSPSVIHLYSAALLELSEKSEKIILRSGGWPVYIGGDDVIALSPVGGALKIARRLRSHMEEAGLLRLLLPSPTRSTSVVVAHYKAPLYLVFARAKDLVERAKETYLIDPECGKRKRDMAAIAIIHRGSIGEGGASIIPHRVRAGDGTHIIDPLALVELLADCSSRGASICLSRSFFNDYRRSLASMEQAVMSAHTEDSRKRLVRSIVGGLEILVERNSPPPSRSHLASAMMAVARDLGSVSKYKAALEKTQVDRCGGRGLAQSILEASEILLGSLQGWA